MAKHSWILALLVVGMYPVGIQAPVEFDVDGNLLESDDNSATQEHGRENIPVGDRVLPLERYRSDQTFLNRTNPSDKAIDALPVVKVKPATEFPFIRPTQVAQTDVMNALSGPSQSGDVTKSKQVQDLALALNALTIRVADIETELMAADVKSAATLKNSAKRLQGECASLQKKIDGLSADSTEKIDLQTTLTALRARLTGLLVPKVDQELEQSSLVQRLQTVVGKLESIQQAIFKDSTSFEKQQRELASLERELTKLKKEAKGSKDSVLIEAINRCDTLIVAINKKKLQPIALVEVPALNQQVRASFYPQQIEPPHKGEQLKNFLCGLVDAFPKQVNPLRGTLMVNNGRLTQLYNEAIAQEKISVDDESQAKGNFITKLFAESPEGDGLVSTRLPVNVARGLTAKTIAQLVRFIQQDPATLNILIKGKEKIDLIERWHVDYLKSFAEKDEKPLQDSALFYQKVRAFLRVLQEYAAFDVQQTTDLLLSFMELKIQRANSTRITSIQEYAQALGVEYAPKYYSEDDYTNLRDFFSKQILALETVVSHLDELLFYVEKAKSKNPVGQRLYFSNLAPMTYDGNGFTGCKENLSRTLFSMIFYNPETGRLDMDMVSGSIRSALPQATQDFIMQYGHLDVHDPASEAAWLQLIENKQGIRYKNQKDGISFEITGGIENGVSVFKMLFGISGEALDAALQNASIDTVTASSTERFVTLLKMLSYPGVHELQIDNVNDANTDGTFDFAIFDPKTQFTIKVGISWTVKHGESMFPSPDGLLNDAIIKNLYLGGESLGQFLLGAYKVPCSFMLASLVRTGALKTEADFLQFFTSYSSAFDRSLPDALYEGSWGDFAYNCPLEVLKKMVQAAKKIGFSMDRPLSKNAFLSDFIKNACIKNDGSALIETLFSLGLNPSVAIARVALNESGGTAADKIKIVKLLLEKGVTKDAIFDMWVAKDIPPSRLQILVAAGLDVNKPLANGLTPLELVITISDNTLLLTYLSKLGVQPSSRTYEYVTRIITAGVQGQGVIGNSSKFSLSQARRLQEQIEGWLEDQVDGNLEMSSAEVAQLKQDSATLVSAIKGFSK